VTETRGHQPDLTTVVVTWRNAPVIARCLAAVRGAASRYSQEIIVVDNHSDDGTPAEAARAAPDARIVVLRENGGFAAGSNVGIATARGRFVALVNGDCFPDRDSLDLLADVLERDPEVGIVGGRLRYADGSHHPSAGTLPTLRSELWIALGLHRAPVLERLGVGFYAAESLYRRPREAGWVTGAFCAARPEIGRLPDGAFMYGEDVEWGAQAARRGFEVRIDPRATAMHMNAYSLRQLGAIGFREARRVEASLRWFAPRGATTLAIERAILCVHALLRLAAAALLLPVRGRRGTDRIRRFAAMLRAALTATVSASGADVGHNRRGEVRPAERAYVP